jgi:hypothetical protein
MILDIEQCQRDIAALDAADKLEASITRQVDSLRHLSPTDLMKKASTMLMSRKLSLEGLGLSENFFEQLEQLVMLNNVARKKYRAIVVAHQNKLGAVEEADIIHE